jgi:hypothetical protein
MGKPIWRTLTCQAELSQKTMGCGQSVCTYKLCARIPTRESVQAKAEVAKGDRLIRRIVQAILMLTIVLLGVNLGSLPASAKLDHDGDADHNPTTSYTEDNDADGVPNNVADSNDNRHPSGNDRSVEHGNSGNQGKAESDPDNDGRGPDRSNGGPDKPNGSGGIDSHDQDGNNGCGNDDDFEDDNEGWCGGKPHEPSAPPSPSNCTPAKPCPQSTPPNCKQTKTCPTPPTAASLTPTPPGIPSSVTPPVIQATLASQTPGATTTPTTPNLPTTGGNISSLLTAAIGCMGVGSLLQRVAHRAK